MKLIVHSYLRSIRFWLDVTYKSSGLTVPYKSFEVKVSDLSRSGEDIVDFTYILA